MVHLFSARFSLSAENVKFSHTFSHTVTWTSVSLTQLHTDAMLKRNATGAPSRSNAQVVSGATRPDGEAVAGGRPSGGSFFVNHRDTEKAPGRFATLVVALPSVHTGGELLVRHGGQEVQLALDTSDPSVVAFGTFYDAFKMSI